MVEGLAFPQSALLSRSTAEALELPSLLAVLARLAATDLGRDRMLALAPFTDEAELARHRQRVEEAFRLVGEASLVPEVEVSLASLLERLLSGRPPVEGIDLVRLADLGKASRQAGERVLAAVPPCPALARLAGELPDLQALLRRVERTLDRRGEVREDASPRLAALRRQIRSVRDTAYRELGDYVQSHKEDLSEETIPLRGGRLVVMLQAGAKGRSGGLVHGRSATGRSLYFEPLHVVETNNSLQQAVEDEQAERRRILQELTDEARAAHPALVEHARFLGELDLLQAAVRFAQRVEGRLVEVSGRHDLVLQGARHPLLDPRLADLREEALGTSGHADPVIPLDVGFTGARRILVVTGPNAGGKTVALKTVGLLAVLAQCGLPIPAAPGSRMPFLRHVVATVGDEQDLLADRSTFSGRLLRLKEAWDAAGLDSLILLDELGSGTDPAEGAALAAALLESLLARGGLCVITTHLAQLASAALELEGATCAAMEFDPESGRPTFRLVPGPPGASEAIALGRRLGLPTAWLDRAEALLGSEHRDLRRLIAEVERIRQELAETREQLETEAADAAKLRRRLADEHAALAEERKGLGKKLRSELDEFRRATSEGMRRELDRMRERFEAGQRKGLAADAVEALFTAAPSFGEAEAAPAGEIEVGGAVRHKSLGWEGTLDKLEDHRAEVLVRGKRVRCRPEELVPTGAVEVPPPARRSRAEPEARAARGRDLDEPAVSPEINLIGLRVEPALEQLDLFLDRALLASRREVRVIHGHGSGRLRDAVRSHLRTHRGVAQIRSGEPNEGGNGATVVTFRGA